MSRNVLFICGSLNQTTMMHQIAQRLEGCNTFFTPFFSDEPISLFARTGLLNFTILGGRHQKNTLQYLQTHRLPMDYAGRGRRYDLIVTCTDLITQKIIRETPTVLVQEGIMEAENWLFPPVKYLKLPRYLANTAATGLSDQYEVFCVASEGYRDDFIRKGVKAHKLIVTGIPNFDNVNAYLTNDFPFKGYVLVATSSARETFKPDDRFYFLKQVKQVANGRPIIIKLHPNEDEKRAVFEIQRMLPEALILSQGDVYEMIANCEVLITQYSTVTFVGVLMGKEVYSYLDVEALRRLLPIQNGGKSAQRIAAICQDLLNKPRFDRQKARQVFRLKPQLSYHRKTG